MLGRRTARDHPDAGLDTYTFDPAGNLTQEQKADGHHIAYNYHFSRLTDVAFSAFPENDIHYQYGYSGDGLNGAGRVVKMEDGSGFSQFSYDAMGNVSENCRTFVLPAEDQAYTFIMSTEYDTWGRTLAMTYPDKERVSYAYGLGGELRSVASFKNGISKSLIDSIHYDKFGDRTAVFYGNGAVQTYAYDPLSRRLNGLRGRTSGNALMQDISYIYDGVGNVTTIENTASPVGSLGGPYTCSYTYDHLNRLTATNCQQGNNGYTEQRTYLDDGRIATYDLNGTRKGYAYNTAHTHTLSNIHTLPNRISEVLLSFGWDAKGNMTAQNDRNGNRRNLLWDERNRLLAVLDNATIGTAAHYVYDAQGERTFKLTGYTNSTGSVETTETYVSLDEPTLYASPYLTATAEGYTKHYFAGTERLASAIGNGGIASIGTHIVDNVALSRKRAERNSLLNRVMGSYPLRVNSNRLDTLYGMTQPGTTAELTFFFHPDHLGSASWITDMSGQPVQHLQYKPFGSEHVDQQAPGTDYSERFRFTGKERDAETGYDYFGARYYSSSLGIWLSVDPMSDKYPNLSPYVYCADNPMKLVDPKGMDTLVFSHNGYYEKKLSGGDNIGVIRGRDGKYATKFEFADERWCERFVACSDYDMFEKNYGREKDDFYYNKIIYVNDKMIESILEGIDFFALRSQSLFDRIDYVKKQSRGIDKSLDFINNKKVQSMNPYALFLTESKGEFMAHDMFNFGNFLWGMSMGRLEIPKWLARLGAHGDCFMHTGKFDSRDDQRSIWFGYNKVKK